jgi:hypothetical protein
MPALARDRYLPLDRVEAPADYNYERFRPRHLILDARRTIARQGVQPGEEAPDFELPRVEGTPLRLSELRGRPVLLRFGSGT